MIKEIYSHIRKFQRMIDKSNVSAHASGAAFFLFLSFIPMVMIVCAALPFTAVSEEEVMVISQSIVPERVYDFFLSIIESCYESSITLLSASAVIAVWSASKGILSMIRGLNAVYRIRESRNYFALRLKAAVCTLLFLAAIILSILIIVFGDAFADLVLPQEGLLAGIWNWVKIFRHVLVACMISIVFCTMYCWLPNNRLPWKSHLPGAAFTSVFWSLYSFAFSIYVDYFGGFSMYGSLTTVVIVMIWLYFCMYIFFCGALINRYCRGDLQVIIIINEKESLTS